MKKIISLLIVLMMSGGIVINTYADNALFREVIIANNTDKKLHWHMITLLGVDDRNGDIKPGETHSLETGGSLEQFEFEFKESGKTTETRGYKIDLDYSANRDWLFSVDGEPFTGNWSVCGMRAETEAASLAGIIGVSALVVAAVSVVTLGVGTGEAILYTGSYASLAASAAASTAATVGTAAAATVATAGAGAMAAAIANDDELKKLSDGMHADKCEWYYNERITLKNGSSDYMLVIKDAEKSTGVLPGKTFVVRQALAGDKIEIKAYLESEQDSLGKDAPVKRGSVTFTQDSEGVVHVEKSGDDYNSEPDTRSRNTVFRNKTNMPISVIREQKMTEPVEILAAKEVDAAGKEVFDQVDSNHTLSDDFRYYSYTDASPVESELTLDFKHTDATIKVNKGSGSSKGSVTLSYDK